MDCNTQKLNRRLQHHHQSSVVTNHTARMDRTAQRERTLSWQIPTAISVRCQHPLAEPLASCTHRPLVCFAHPDLYAIITVPTVAVELRHSHERSTVHGDILIRDLAAVVGVQGQAAADPDVYFISFRYPSTDMEAECPSPYLLPLSHLNGTCMMAQHTQGNYHNCIVHCVSAQRE